MAAVLFAAAFDGDLVVPMRTGRPKAAGVIVLEPRETSPDVYLQREFTMAAERSGTTGKIWSVISA